MRLLDRICLVSTRISQSLVTFAQNDAQNDFASASRQLCVVSREYAAETRAQSESKPCRASTILLRIGILDSRLSLDLLQAINSYPESSRHR